MRKYLAGLVVIALAVSVSGCARNYYLGEEAPEITEEAAAGTWVHPGPKGITALLSLADDGSFSVSEVPFLRQPSSADLRAGKVLDDTQVDWSILYQGAGSWRVATESDGAYPAIYLSYDEARSDKPLLPFGGPGDTDWSLANYSLLTTLTVGNSTQLMMSAGDPDAKYRFMFTQQ